MIEDVKTVMWKETKELIAMQGSFKGFVVRYVIAFGAIGIYMPYMLGRIFVELPFVVAWVPIVLGIGVIVDSIAGERERHTLETLLASRLPDRAVLYGKIMSNVLYCFIITLPLLALGLVVANVAFWDGQVAFYPPQTLAFSLFAALLLELFLAAVGVLISMRAPTVRQGSEMLTVSILAMVAIPFVIVYVLFSVMPDGWKRQIVGLLSAASATSLEIGVLAVLLVLSAVALLLAARSFRRDKFILD
jgi:ABC-2 type transport system permease protein